MIHVFEVQPFIATLAAMFLARGLCYIIGNESITIDNPFFVADGAAAGIPLGGWLSITPSVIVAPGRRR